MTTTHSHVAGLALAAPVASRESDREINHPTHYWQVVSRTMSPALQI